MERRARMARAEAPESAPDPTAATEAAELELPPEIVAQSLGQWFRGWMVRIRSGDSGVLPVILGLVIITLVFEAVSPHNLFLSAGNLVNLFQQSAVIMVLAMAEIFALLLGEIDLSVGYVGAVGGVIAVQLVQPRTTNWPWWAAIIAALLVCAVIGGWQGTLITRLRLPSLIAIVSVVVVGICNINRANTGVVEGVPWVIPIVLFVFGAWMLLLQRTQFGRYVYAIGGNPEAARRAGIKLAAIRTWCFVLCSLTAGIGGILYASYLGGMSNNVNGGQLVLYAVAAAVIGGTSLFGGRGKVLHGLLGGLVVGGIYNGLYLLSFDVQWTFIVTGFVLLVAATIDSLSRRSATSGSAARV